jgi:hypothetical protein
VTRAHLRDELISLLGFLIAPPLNGAGEPMSAPGFRTRAFLSALSGALGVESGGESRNGESRNGEANGSRGEAPHG